MTEHSVGVDGEGLGWGAAARTVIFGIATAAVLNCASGGSRDLSRGVRLQIPRGLWPAPGLCRILPPRRPALGYPGARTCDGIEHQAPLDSRVLYRPEGVQELHVRYMSSTARGVVHRMDVFSTANLRLIREVNE